MLYIKNESLDNNTLIVNDILIRQIVIEKKEVIYFQFKKLNNPDIIYESELFNLKHLENYKYNGLLSNILELISLRVFDIGEISNIELRMVINEIQLFYKTLERHNAYSYHDLRGFEITASHVLTFNNGTDFIIVNDINQIKNESFNVEIYRENLYYYYNLSFKKEMNVYMVLDYLNTVKNYNFITVEDNLGRGYDNISNKSNLKREVKTFYNQLLYQLS